MIGGTQDPNPASFPGRVSRHSLAHVPSDFTIITVNNENWPYIYASGLNAKAAFFVVHWGVSFLSAYVDLPFY